MGIVDYIILSVIILFSCYGLYRAFWKKDKCADCSESMDCSSSTKGPVDFEKLLDKKLSDKS